MSSKASLKVVSHQCLQEQTQNVNGVNKHVRVVVKGQPSRVQIQLVGAEPGFSFRNVALEAILLYDGPAAKPVDWIKVKPLEYSGQIEERNPLLYTLELMIKVLSSQHEDSLFKVKIQALNAQTRQVLPHLVAFTSEILVISKPEVLKPKAPKGGQKRTRDDQVLQYFTRLDKRLEDMATTMRLNKYCNNSTAVSNYHASVEEAENVPPTTSFESAISTLLSAYKSLTPEERPEKTRRVMRALKPEDSSILSEALKMMMGETSVGLHGNGSIESQDVGVGSTISLVGTNDESEIPLGVHFGVDYCGGIDFDFQRTNTPHTSESAFNPLRTSYGGYDLFSEIGASTLQSFDK